MTIPGPWTLILDVLPAEIDYFVVDGTLMVPNSFANDFPFFELVANNIWIRAGEVIIGDAENNPYPGKLNITLKGNHEINFLEDVQGSRILLVTGRLIIFGQK